MRRMLVPLAVLGLALSAGCGGGNEAGNDASGPGAGVPASAAAPGSAESKAQQVENLIADCMKKQGFQYVPHALPEAGEDVGRYSGQLSVLEPADQVRKFREKYGFGVLSRAVYPNDPAVKIPDIDPAKNPNNAIREGLDPARRKAYDLALEGVTDPGFDNKGTSNGKKGDVTKPGCAAKAGAQVYGDTGPDEAGQKAKERSWSAFQTDPEAVAAAQKWADCLRGRGYKVKDTRPGEIETALASMAMDGELPVGPGAPAGVPTEGAVTAAAGGGNAVPPAAAQAGLQLEIKAALADLDCRTDYATLVRTKYAKVLRDGDGKS